MGRIQEIGQKIKNVLEDVLGEWGLIIIVFLVALISFGLGRLSALQQSRAPISVTQAPFEVRPRAMTPGGLILGSKSGTTYHFPWCPGAAKIAPQNQRWFQSEKEARNAGYAPAKNCKGLK